LKATEEGKAKRPHQAFLLLRDQDTGLEATLPFSVKENGKGRLDFVGLGSYISANYRLIISRCRKIFQFNF
jgi:hypothetical protein